MREGQARRSGTKHFPICLGVIKFYVQDANIYIRPLWKRTDRLKNATHHSSIPARDLCLASASLYHLLPAAESQKVLVGTVKWNFFKNFNAQRFLMLTTVPLLRAF